VSWLTDPLQALYFQRALLEVELLAVAGGVLGAWVVLRRMAFFAHAVGTAAFPGLVVAGPWGIAPQLAGLVSGLALAGSTERLSARRGVGRDTATGLGLVAALALGTILASDVYRSGSGVDKLLFGSVLGISDTDVAVSAIAAGGALALSAGFGRAWLVAGFDADGAGALGVRRRVGDAVLLGALAGVVVASLNAVGALLAGSLLVIPAATVALVAPSVRALRLGAVALAALEGLVGLYAADALDAPPGPGIAVLASGVFALVAAGTHFTRGPA
jgi:ABC-type Mn2+/Zn2+ transport system permease subunit